MIAIPNLVLISTGFVAAVCAICTVIAVWRLMVMHRDGENFYLPETYRALRGMIVMLGSLTFVNASLFVRWLYIVDDTERMPNPVYTLLPTQACLIIGLLMVVRAWTLHHAGELGWIVLALGAFFLSGVPMLFMS